MPYDTSGTAEDASRANRGTCSRRALLGACGLGLASAVSGCTSLPTGGSTSSSPESQSESDVFQEISFEGPQMIVELREGHSVERLNLVAPDGSEFSSTEISAGVSTEKIRLLDISPGLNRYEHYEPGEYSLVAAKKDGSVTEVSLSLKPSLRIIELSAAKGPSGPEDRLQVRVENNGTGPTWVYDIAYQNLENGQTSKLGELYGLPEAELRIPKEAEKAIISPNESRAYVGRESPFLFGNKAICQGTTLQGTVTVASPVDSEAEQSFEVELQNGARSTDPSTQSETYYCNSITPSMSEKNEE